MGCICQLEISKNRYYFFEGLQYRPALYSWRLLELVKKYSGKFQRSKILSFGQERKIDVY
jgi:hypothetical protein